RSERISRFSGRYVHHPANAVLARKKASREYGQEKDVNDIGAKPIPDIALAKHCNPAVVFAHRYSAQPVLAPRRFDVLGQSMWRLIQLRLAVEHLGPYEIWRGLSLWLDHILPGGRETIYRGQYDIQAGDRQQQVKIPGRVNTKKPQASIDQLLGRQQFGVVSL